jgi:hypothetical protein
MRRDQQKHKRGRAKRKQGHTQGIALEKLAQRHACDPFLLGHLQISRETNPT